MSINLLPWRKNLAKKKLLRLGFISGILLALSLVMTLHFYAQELKRQKSDVILLTSLKKQFRKISKSPTENALPVYQALKSKIIKITGFRNLRIALSEKLLAIIEKTPAGISLTRLSISEKQIIIEGFSSHKRSLESYMEKLSRLFSTEKFSIKMHEAYDKIEFKVLVLSRKKM